MEGIVMKLARTVVLIAVTCLGGCAAPETFTAQGLSYEGPITWSRKQVTLTEEASDLSQWWKRFSDPLLSELIADALDASTEIAAARATVQQALALRDAARANLSPTISFSTSAQRSVTGEGFSATSLSAGVDGGWYPDIYGARHNAVQSSEANLLIVQARFGGVQGSVASGVALTYMALRANQLRLELARESLTVQLDILQITRWRHQAGLISAVEWEQATVAAGQIRAQLPALEVAIQKAAHALAVQLGKPPAALSGMLMPPAAIPQTSLMLVPDNPKDVLRQRPDVRAARYAVDKAVADVAQARTLHYPALKLGGSLGVGAATLEALSAPGAAISALVLGLSGPLWDGGAAEAQVHAQQWALELAQTNYRATALAALQDIEDAMASLRWDTERWQQLKDVGLAAGNAATMARQRYASGLVDFQVVLETQRSLLTTRDNLAMTTAEVSSDQVRLYNALGGGWHAGTIHD
jgi:NodT family efflux transporter outer membrane factor (OMF) lipoprotein